ncbi:MAG: hypothetical protein AB8H79_20800 [Myxococcota bacterium]
MDHGVWIFRDDEFDSPIHADPAVEDVEPSFWQEICEHVLESFEGDGPRFDTVQVGDDRLGWKLHARTGVTVVVQVSAEIGVSELKGFITELCQRYFDEVDDARFPEPGGVADVLLDVIPPWED